MWVNSSESKLIEVRINGEARRVPSGTSVEQLLGRLGVPLQGTAVELAGEILAPGAFGGTKLRAGQSLEIVRMVGGG